MAYRTSSIRPHSRAAGGRRVLGAMILDADIVVEASRPRVMDQLGIDPTGVADQGTSWLSITGYGRQGSGAVRVGFGDDAAVEGGLYIEGDPPLFVAVEIPLSRVAAWAGGRPAAAQVLDTQREWEASWWGSRSRNHARSRALRLPQIPMARPSEPSFRRYFGSEIHHIHNITTQSDKFRSSWLIQSPTVG